MKSVLKSTLLLLCVLVMTVAALPTAAAESGTLHVTLETKDKQPIDGMTVQLCQVATVDSTGYYPAAAFENSGISIAAVVNDPDEAVAQTLMTYVNEHGVDSLSAASAGGKTTFTALPLGIWLVYGEASDEYAFNPYLVFLPQESNGRLQFEVSSAPKVEDNRPHETQVYVLKKWEDDQNAAHKRPDSITVELLNGSTVVAEAALNEDNGWSHTFQGVPKGGTYSVREKAVPDYEVQYGGDAVNGFVITNTYVGEKLPQTGQYWWPIVILAIVGVCFVVLGIYEMGAKWHDEKT